MRFRATIVNIDTFVKVVQAVEKLQKRCIVKFGENDMRIICTGDVNEGGIQVWSQIQNQSLFTDYRIQSNSKNEIAISVSSEALLAALRSAAGPSLQNNNTFVAGETEILMKLAKNHEKKSVLSFEISSVNAMNRRMTVIQQLLIDVLRHAEVDRLQEPMCPEPDVRVKCRMSICFSAPAHRAQALIHSPNALLLLIADGQVHILLPPLIKLRTVVERLRPLATEGISFRANHRGELQLAVSTDNARVEVGWSGLTNPPMNRDAASQVMGEEVDAKDTMEMHGVLVSHKCLLKFLNSHVISTTTIACICANHCMIIYVYIGNLTESGGVLTFYVPAQLDEP